MRTRIRVIKNRFLAYQFSEKRINFYYQFFNHGIYEKRNSHRT